MSKASIEEPVRPEAVMRMRMELYICDHNGDERENITDALESVLVDVDNLAEIKATATVRLREQIAIQPLRDCFKPRMVLEWRDSAGKYHDLNESLGVYYFLFPDQDVTETFTLDTFECVDGLWRVDQLTTDALLWLPEEADHGAMARSLVDGKVGRMPILLPDTATSMKTPRTIFPNQRVREAMNDLYEAADFWDMAARREDGALLTYKRSVLGQSSPQRVLVSEDVLGTIQKRPDREAFCNQVFLSSNSPDGDISMRDGYKVSFVDPESPYSTVNTFPVSHELADSKDESFTTMRHRAILMLEAAAGIQERIIVPHWPDPRFDYREPWELNIEQRSSNVVASGMFRVEKMMFGGTPDSVAQVTTLSHLVNTERFFSEQD